MAAPRNRTVRLTAADRRRLRPRLIKLRGQTDASGIVGKTIHQNLFQALPNLPAGFADLIFVDPPYNLNRSFGEVAFRSQSIDGYGAWLEEWLPALLRAAKPDATVYLCGDWRSSSALHAVAAKHLVIRNRITWEREKGRGAKQNWKNASEDIFFCTLSGRYQFHVNDVMLRRRVRAPYRNENGLPKDWTGEGAQKLRDTYPSNLWMDITVPFWSMAENTDHPTQKPEKLLAKLILASTGPGDTVLDPFLGSGTTSVVAKKLGRQWVGIEQDLDYCLLAEKRLELAESDVAIQGYTNGIFWERNSQ